MNEGINNFSATLDSLNTFNTISLNGNNGDSDELSFREQMLLKKIFSYILEMKKENYELSAVEIVTNYCFKNNLEIEYIGALISQTEWFKNFISNDCDYCENENKIDDW